MRLVAFVAGILLAAAAGAGGSDGRRPRQDRNVDVFVPVDPSEHERLHWFDGRPHGLVPRVISVNRAPYVCDADRQRFGTEDDFVYHLRRAHKLAWEEIPPRLIVHEGQVHYLGAR